LSTDTAAHKGQRIEKLLEHARVCQWKSFVHVLNNFLGSTKAVNQAILVGSIIEAFQKLGVFEEYKDALLVLTHR